MDDMDFLEPAGFRAIGGGRRRGRKRDKKKRPMKKRGRGRTLPLGDYSPEIMVLEI